jgi:hypothetical protein
MRHGSAIVQEQAATSGRNEAASDWPDAAALGRRLLLAARRACAAHADLARGAGNNGVAPRDRGLAVPSLVELLERSR